MKKELEMEIGEIPKRIDELKKILEEKKSERKID